MSNNLKAEVVVIGGGPAGMAAAVSAWEHGARRVFLLERGQYLGGILNQCIHPGFGLNRFGEELTGPEYAMVYQERLERSGVRVMTGTTVLQVSSDRRVWAVNRQGVHCFQARSVILAMGCRERTRDMLQIPGSRPAGVLTAGLAQYLINIEGYLPGKKVLILGSGDIGLIVARRLVLEGAQVEAVVEIRDSLSGLVRNYVQCLTDYQIPLLLSQTVTCIHGDGRVNGVTVAMVDQAWNPLPDTERLIECDTVLFSVGLIPENELSRQAQIPLSPVSGGPLVDEWFQTRVPGFYACGNVSAVFDLVDYVSLVSERAGQAAAKSIKQSPVRFVLQAGPGVNLVIPQLIREGSSGDLFLRPSRAVTRGSLQFSCRNEVFFRKSIPVCRPSEMIHLDLSTIFWPEEGGEVCVSLDGKSITGIT